MESSVVSLNFNKICRVCLTENEEMHSLFSQISQEDCLEEVNCCLHKMLMSISSMKVCIPKASTLKLKKQSCLFID